VDLLIENNKIRSDDRIIVLKPKEGMDVLNTSGIVDKRLFSGENQLHAIKDPETCFWSLRYDAGTLSEPLKGSWNSFNKLINHVTDYFSRRNIEVIEVKD